MASSTTRTSHEALRAGTVHVPNVHGNDLIPLTQPFDLLSPKLAAAQVRMYQEYRDTRAMYFVMKGLGTARYSTMNHMYSTNVERHHGTILIETAPGSPCSSIQAFSTLMRRGDPDGEVKSATARCALWLEGVALLGENPQLFKAYWRNCFGCRAQCFKTNAANSTRSGCCGDADHSKK